MNTKTSFYLTFMSEACALQVTRISSGLFCDVRGSLVSNNGTSAFCVFKAEQAKMPNGSFDRFYNVYLGADDE
jgi:hypothetical protein